MQNRGGKTQNIKIDPLVYCESFKMHFLRLKLTLKQWREGILLKCDYTLRLPTLVRPNRQSNKIGDFIARRFLLTNYNTNHSLVFKQHSGQLARSGNKMRLGHSYTEF